jgi:hypothetical protein
MAVIENVIEVQCPAEVVFDALVDVRNEARWNPDLEWADKLSDGPVALGTQFRAKWKQSQVLVVECTQFERPHRWTHHNGGPVEVQLSCLVVPSGGGTRLRTRFAARPHGWFRLVFPIFVVVMRRAERANMTRIKAFLENEIAIDRPAPAEA